MKTHQKTILIEQVSVNKAHQVKQLQENTVCPEIQNDSKEGKLGIINLRLYHRIKTTYFLPLKKKTELKNTSFGY